jgi:hypothetical protein
MCYTAPQKSGIRHTAGSSICYIQPNFYRNLEVLGALREGGSPG